MTISKLLVCRPRLYLTGKLTFFDESENYQEEDAELQRQAKNAMKEECPRVPKTSHFGGLLWQSEILCMVCI
jgi:hypothetical protein